MEKPQPSSDQICLGGASCDVSQTVVSFSALTGRNEHYIYINQVCISYIVNTTYYILYTYYILSEADSSEVFLQYSSKFKKYL